MKCKKCGKDIEKDSKFCQYCGQRVEENNKPEEILEVDKEFLDHLDFLGYDVEKESILENVGAQSYIAKNKAKFNLFFYQSGDLGVTFNAMFNLDRKKVEKNKLALLEIINKANGNKVFGSNWIGDNNNVVANTALYLGEYNKKRFATFLDLFVNTTQTRNAEMDFLKKFT